jgi:curli biogenesis system outer membrane secretion channel CsgG
MRSALAVAVTMALAGCLSTPIKSGDTPNAVSGAAGGATAEGGKGNIESCTETLGTMAFDEDTRADWYSRLRHYNLPSTIPVMRLMVQQSNCFVVVERGRSLNNMMRERQLMRGGEGRADSNMGGGQMVAADYTMAPEIFFSGRTGGGTAGVGSVARYLPGPVGWVAGAAAGSISQNEASTTLLLIDNRSGVQVSAAEGYAKNMDMGLVGRLYGGGSWAGAGAYSQTPQGRVILAAFVDSYNKMVTALRSYKAQTVRGGLGTGGRLGVQGGSTPASKEVPSK